MNFCWLYRVIYNYVQGLINIFKSQSYQVCILSHFFLFSYLISYFRIDCFAIVDSGTSGIGIPSEYYDTILDYVTKNNKCNGLKCYNVKESDFPVLLISLKPDNVFPLMPADYLECFGTLLLFYC
jgi:hypothetical protein